MLHTWLPFTLARNTESQKKKQCQLICINAKDKILSESSRRVFHLGNPTSRGVPVLSIISHPDSRRKQCWKLLQKPYSQMVPLVIQDGVSRYTNNAKTEGFFCILKYPCRETGFFRLALAQIRIIGRGKQIEADSEAFRKFNLIVRIRGFVKFITNTKFN